MVSLLDGLGDGLLYEVCVNNVGHLGCDIIHVVSTNEVNLERIAKNQLLEGSTRKPE
jgi:hypothetical protein